MENNELYIERTFNAQPKDVWKAWTDPKRLMQWWGPKDFTSPVCKIDFRVGGKYLNCMRAPDGKDYWSTGVYKEIIPQEKIVCTDSFADEAGNVVPASHYGMEGEFPLTMQVIMTLVEKSGKTKMKLRHIGMPNGEHGEMARIGWNQSFDKLDDILKTNQ